MHLASHTDSPRRKPPLSRPRTSVVPLARPDTRTRFGRRWKQLVADFTDALRGQGTINAVLAMKVQDAAMLKAIAERARADYLEGRKITLGHLIRVERRADNAV